MYLTTHAAVGVLIAQQTHNPGLAFGGAFLSHFVLDFVPHGDEDIGPEDFSVDTVQAWLGRKKKWIVALSLLDFAGTAALVLSLFLTVELPAFNLVMLGIIGAVLPDFFLNVFPAIHSLAPFNRAIRFIDWWYRKILLAPIVRRINRFHVWIHNPLHERLPVHLSRKIGVLLQLLILSIFLTAEISTLGK